MTLTPDEALKLFADAPPSQLMLEVDPADWTEAYLRELRSGKPSTVTMNGRQVPCRTVHIDEAARRVWLEPIGEDATAEAEALGREYWTRPEVLDYVGKRDWRPTDQTA